MLSSLVCMVGIACVYIDTIFALFFFVFFWGGGEGRGGWGRGGYFFFIPIFTALFAVRAWLFGHLLFWLSYVHVFCSFVFALVQRN